MTFKFCSIVSPRVTEAEEREAEEREVGEVGAACAPFRPEQLH